MYKKIILLFILSKLLLLLLLFFFTSIQLMKYFTFQVKVSNVEKFKEIYNSNVL